MIPFPSARYFFLFDEAAGRESVFERLIHLEDEQAAAIVEALNEELESTIRPDLSSGYSVFVKKASELTRAFWLRCEADVREVETWEAGDFLYVQGRPSLSKLREMVNNFASILRGPGEPPIVLASGADETLTGMPPILIHRDSGILEMAEKRLSLCNRLREQLAAFSDAWARRQASGPPETSPSVSEVYADLQPLIVSAVELAQAWDKEVPGLVLLHNDEEPFNIWDVIAEAKRDTNKLRATALQRRQWLVPVSLNEGGNSGASATPSGASDEAHPADAIPVDATMGIAAVGRSAIQCIDSVEVLKNAFVVKASVILVPSVEDDTDRLRTCIDRVRMAKVQCRGKMSDTFTTTLRRTRAEANMPLVVEVSGALTAESFHEAALRLAESVSEMNLRLGLSNQPPDWKTLLKYIPQLRPMEVRALREGVEDEQRILLRVDRVREEGESSAHATMPTTSDLVQGAESTARSEAPSPTEEGVDETSESDESEEEVKDVPAEWFSVDVSHKILVFRDQAYPIASKRAAAGFETALKAKGGYVPAPDGLRWSEVRAALPGPLKKYLHTRRGSGGGARLRIK